MRSTVTVMSSPIFTDSPGRLVRINIGVHSPVFFRKTLAANSGRHRHCSVNARTGLNTPLHSGAQRMTCGQPVWNLCEFCLTSNLPVMGRIFLELLHLLTNDEVTTPGVSCSKARK